MTRLARTEAQIHQCNEQVGGWPLLKFYPGGPTHLTRETLGPGVRAKKQDQQAAAAGLTFEQFEELMRARKLHGAATFQPRRHTHCTRRRHTMAAHEGCTRRRRELMMATFDGSRHPRARVLCESRA